MSKRSKKAIVLVLLLSLMVAASWLYVKSQLDYTAHRDKLATIHQLHQASSRLVSDVLLVENGSVNNFDHIAQTEVRIEELLAGQADDDASRQLMFEVNEFLSIVSKIKASYAVYLNTVAYFPKSVLLLRDVLQKIKAKEELAILNNLERDILTYTLLGVNQTALNKEKIVGQLESLQQRIKLHNINARSLEMIVVRHGYVLLNYSGKLNALNARLLNNKVAESIQAVVDNYDDNFNESLRAAKSVRSGFYVVIFVLLYLSFILWHKQRDAMQKLSENTRDFSLALKTSKQNQFSVDVASKVVTLGKTYSEALGLGSKEYYLTIEEWESNLHPEDKVAVASLFHDCLTTGVDFNIEYRWKSRSGSWLWVSSVGRTIEFDAKGKPLRMAGVSVNVSERKANERVLRVIAESSPSVSGKKDVLRTIVKELAQAQGMKYALIAKINEVNHHMVDTIAIWAGDDFADNFSYPLDGTPCQNILSEGACVYPKGVQTLFPEDHILVDMGAVSYVGVPLRDSHNRVIGLLALLDVEPMVGSAQMKPLMLSLATRITMEIERKDVEQQLVQMAHYDVLTGLPNRALLSDRFLQAQAHSERVDTLLAVCFLDLDDFKPINDEYGHGVGDLLLKEVSTRLLDSIRRDDTVSRLGGDEFVLLIGEISTVEECELSLDRIIHALSMPYELSDGTLKVSASIGYSLIEGSSNELDALIRQADQAMYVAKTKGKNRYSRFDSESDHRAVKKQSELSKIRRALVAKEFCLYYQPKVNMRTGELYGAEALIRWLHPEKGVISPFGFLPVVDGNKMEIKIGDWVIAEGLQQLDDWQRDGIELELSINISSYHLLSHHFLSVLKQLLAKHPDVSPAKLQLEILESSVLGDIGAISEILESCRDELGVKIALDDFGTGYSSLTHLRQLPAGTVKIDRTFVRDILNDENDLAIVKAVVGLADSFKLDVIAEGVETVDQGLKLLQIGCDRAQGFGIAKPMPAMKMLSWIKSYQPNQKWLNLN
ncbi:MAG: hypothetical protein A6F70_08175 [Cycloclasticus sp. symbiont of Bathymodiolus heckerae]|nr:MAG: hypothetical protein A6F70_08175 [Cycloclasticus sp. symbiont of Bathymodiolus heckerae]